MATYYPSSVFPVQFVNPDTGALAENFTIEAYIAGTSTPTNMYTDKDGTSAGSTITLNAGGWPQVSGSIVVIWLDFSVSYKFIFKDAASNTEWTIDNLSKFSTYNNTSLITHTQDGTDYLLSTYLDNRHIVYASDHNAVADVVELGNSAITGTDASAEIQAAIEAARGGICKLDPGKRYRIDTGIYIPGNTILDCQGAWLYYTGTGTGLGQTTSWAAGVATGAVAGITLGEEDGSLQYLAKMINCNIKLTDPASTAVCLYGITQAYVEGYIEGYTNGTAGNTNIGVLVRGSAVASNFGNVIETNCNHFHEGSRVQNWGVSNTFVTGNLYLNFQVNGDYSFDTSSIGINFADSTLTGQGQGTKVIGGNIERTVTGIYVGDGSESIYIDTRWEIGTADASYRNVKCHANAKNIHVKGSGIDAAQIGAVAGGFEGFDDGGNFVFDAFGNVRHGGAEHSFAGKTPPIVATNFNTLFLKDDASKEIITRTDDTGSGRLFIQEGAGSGAHGAFLDLYGADAPSSGATATKGELKLGGCAGRPTQILNGLGGAILGQFDNSGTSNQTGFLLFDVNTATLKRVEVGANDSGGTGYKMLRITN